MTLDTDCSWSAGELLDPAVYERVTAFLGALWADEQHGSGLPQRFIPVGCLGQVTERICVRKSPVRTCNATVRVHKPA
jgi:hypothetical protein